MPPPKLIPDNLQAEVLQRAGRGETGEQIAAWLSEELTRQRGQPVTVVKQRVNELLARIRKERAPIAQAVVAAAVAQHVGADLNAVDELVQRARAAEDRARRLEAVAMGEPLPDELSKLDDGVERQIVNDKGQIVSVDPDVAIKAMEQQRKERAEQARLAELRLKLSGAGEGGNGAQPVTGVIILPPEDPIP
jgi:hypothetical protein